MYVATPTRSYTAGESILRYLRVTAAGLIAGVGVRGIGTNVYSVYGVGAAGAIRTWNAEGSHEMVANGAISAGAYVYAAAGGKIAATGFVCVGIAMEAAALNNDVIEVIACDGPDGVAAIAAAGSTVADATLTTAKIVSVSGADGTKGVILQDLEVGDTCEVYNEHATNGLKIYPPTGDTLNGGSANGPVAMEGKGRAQIRKLDGTNWSVDFIVNS